MKRYFLLVLTLILMTRSIHADEPLPPEKLPAQPGFPELLRLEGGKDVRSIEEWTRHRRGELKRLVQDYMYGEVPPAYDPVTAELLHENTTYLDGKATLREIALKVGRPSDPPLHLLLVTPNRQTPAAVFVGLNFSGNHSLVTDPKVNVPTGWMYDKRYEAKNFRATEAGRGKAVDVWAIDQSVARGYAVATIYNGDIDPDRADKREGLRPYLASKGAKPATIAAWVWGIHRAVDYLVTRKDVDSTRIIVVGHSRLGKTALLAAAFDGRIAMAIPHQAGCGGTAPSRVIGASAKAGKAETVKLISERFPHWFNDQFKKFNEHPEHLPFDQHALVALCAPRPVLFSNAAKDLWANPEGQFEVLKAADPVYELWGRKGLASKEMPASEVLSDGPLGYYIRPGEHSMTRGDWKIFLDFADKHLPK